MSQPLHKIQPSLPYPSCTERLGGACGPLYAMLASMGTLKDGETESMADVDLVVNVQAMAESPRALYILVLGLEHACITRDARMQ
jgi:hypothetical protein